LLLLLSPSGAAIGAQTDEGEIVVALAKTDTQPETKLK
jgi:hypothetical protein